MFVVKKNINGRDYYYLRKSARINGKVKAITLAYLGSNRKLALEKAKDFKEKPSVMKMTDDKSREIVEKEKKAEKTEISEFEKHMLSIDELAVFCKRKGFVYPSAEIYGGLAGFWDFGHLGVELKNNIKSEWWNYHVRKREDMAGIDGAIITNPKVWEASGHISTFFDVAVKCRKCKSTTKIDASAAGKEKCEKCGGEFEVLGKFNQLFPVKVGALNPVEAYLRGETAQLIFTIFRLVQENARMSLPFGIAQMGKAFRNEISPREFIFRCREFEQMEIEYFIAPGMKCPYADEIVDSKIAILDEDAQRKGKEAVKLGILEALKKGVIKRDWHAYWISLVFNWFILNGANPEHFRLRQHLSDERSHYSSDTWDLEYQFPMGWRELQGFADRSNYDLSQHEKFSKKKLSIHDEKLGTVLPEVVCEPSLGVERAFIVFMLEAYRYDKERENVILELSPKLAPYKVAVFPLISKGKVFEVSREVFKDLLEEFNVFFDNSGSIGRRYARQDEAGTPYCITVDNESIEDKKVTIRDRDTTKQVRLPIQGLRDSIRKLINDEATLEDL